MLVVRKISRMRTLVQRAKRNGKKIGFVPTMGALHEGHLSLIHRCRKETDLCIMSLFVNPLQFGPHEDFLRYPRSLNKDEMFAKKENVDIIFYPSEKEMYPDCYLTYIHVQRLTAGLCGRFRPGHFQGVTTIVGKLLHIVSPDILYLGQKDAQQAIVLKKMIEDLNFSLKVRILPTVREPDGLAMSSRNSNLTTPERKGAPILYRSLRLAKKEILKGERNAQRIIQLIQKEIQTHSSASLDYVECVDAQNLVPLKILRKEVLIALAAWFGRTRLIDNIRLRVP